MTIPKDFEAWRDNTLSKIAMCMGSNIIVPKMKQYLDAAYLRGKEREAVKPVHVRDEGNEYDCRECGEEIHVEHAFCHHCGVPLDWSE